MQLKDGCIQYHGNKKDCVVSQKGKTYRIINRSASLLTVYEVDPCLICDRLQKKCDYLVLVEGNANKKAVFVELKGADITTAIHQIENTVKLLRASIKEYLIFGRIIARRVTPDIKSRRLKLDEKLRCMGGNLVIATNSAYQEEL